VRFHIKHATEYFYSRPVFLEPHIVRLRPRCDGAQDLTAFHLDIEPKPQMTAESLDLEGNTVLCAWFSGLIRSCRIETRCEVETRRANPYDFLLTDPACERLPADYAPDLQPRLAPYRRPNANPSGPVAGLAREAADSAGGDTLRFLPGLTERIAREFEVEIRDEGDPFDAGTTLAARRGACRDLAVLYVECCRCLGLAARFVSGYQEGEDRPDRRYMHAWAEVYLPGGGWRGFDPTGAVAVADRHVAVAAAAEPAGASPLSGTFRGTGATSRIEAQIHIEASE